MEYCSHCYVSGSFTRPNISLGEMKVLVQGKMREMGFPGFLAKMFTMRMGKLKRWAK